MALKTAPWDALEYSESGDKGLNWSDLHVTPTGYGEPIDIPRRNDKVGRCVDSLSISHQRTMVLRWLQG